MTASIADLRQHFEHENQLWKQGDHYRQGRVRDAYNAWFRASVRAGNPPDALVRKIEDETERFLDRVIAGVDGHSYWNGGERFHTNDGKSVRPRRWWYEHVNDVSLGNRDTVKPTCGEHLCIAPHHQDVTLWSEAQRHYSDQSCVGALQVAAMKLGRTPTIQEYEDLGLRPSARAISVRFSAWTRAIAAAGLPPVETRAGYKRSWTNEDLLGALKTFREETGRVPTGIEWTNEHRRPSQDTIRRRFGGWHVALVKAGLV